MTLTFIVPFSNQALTCQQTPLHSPSWCKYKIGILTTFLLACEQDSGLWSSPSEATPLPSFHRFTDMVATASNRQTFVTSATRFLHTHGFDGLDLDWEYPGSAESCSRQREIQSLAASVAGVTRVS